MLTSAQQTIHDRYTAIGFTITDRPFAGTDRTKWYFANRPDSDERRADFSINLDSGISHQMGTNQLRTIDQAEAEYGVTLGERKGVSPPIEIPSVQTPRPATRKQESRPKRKKQAALF